MCFAVCCSVMYCVCCRVLYCVCCSVLQCLMCVAVCCSVVYCVCCSAWCVSQCVAVSEVCCSVLQSAVLCLSHSCLCDTTSQMQDAVSYMSFMGIAVRCSVLQCVAMRCIHVCVKGQVKFTG